MQHRKRSAVSTCRSALAFLVLPMLSIVLLAAGARTPARQGGAGMTVDQVMAMPKIDAHAHLRPMSAGQRQAFAAFLEKQNFQWLDICTGGMNWTRLKAQIAEAEEAHRGAPARIAWATSFDLSNWASPDWGQAARATVGDGFKQGAVAVKVWKDVGMVLKDKDGRYVMIDDARFDPLLEAIADQGHPLVAHLGEPRNCWLPVEKMTVESDRSYFAKNPQYHGYLHPEVPAYEKQVASRDAMLARHPRLKVIGCHLGSLEYDVDELAKRLDRYPNFAVDLAARLVHLQIQPREKVRAFILKYQDRLLYGTDSDFGGGDGATASTERALTQLAAMYRAEATWLATDQSVAVPRAREGFTSTGLALPATVLEKIYFANAKKWYPGI
jgi:predicted TIM-barrel fold metal-dependent hydrolase